MTDSQEHIPGQVIVDVVVIGGGSAGLAGATALARSRRTVLVVDSGAPRNAPAAGVHNYLSRDGLSPVELLALGRAEVEDFGAAIWKGGVDRVERDGAGFRVSTSDGRTARARRILLATGAVDTLPDIPGLADRWGRDVVHCPFCHGWEVRDLRIGVLATSAVAGHSVGMWRQLSDDVTLLLNNTWDPDAGTLERLTAMAIRVVPGAVARVAAEDDALTGVVLSDGSTVPLDVIAVTTRVDARAGMVADLGLVPEEFAMGDLVFGTRIASDATGRTSVAGVWAAGNVTDPMAHVISSAAAGLMAGSQIHADLIATDTAAAVARQRESVTA